MATETTQNQGEVPENWDDETSTRDSQNSTPNPDDQDGSETTPGTNSGTTPGTNQHFGKGKGQFHGKGYFHGKGKGGHPFHEYGRGKPNLSLSLSLAEAEYEKAKALLRVLELKSEQEAMLQPVPMQDMYPHQHQHQHQYHQHQHQHVPNPQIPQQMAPCAFGKGYFDKKFTVDCKHGLECKRFIKDDSGRVRFACTFKHSREELSHFYAKCRDMDIIAKHIK